MDLQHRLSRQMIGIAVNKAMEDMKSNTKRSIRNLLDLGLFFGKSENQKWFFTTAKQVIANPNNPYNSLVTRMISDTDKDTIKKVGLNLGYSSLIYGASKLRKEQEDLGFSIPWFITLSVSKSRDDSFQQMDKIIREARELGIYSYIIYTQNEEDIEAICEFVKQFDECLFMLRVSPHLISEQTAYALGKIHNMIISIQVGNTEYLHGSICKGDENPFQLLKKNNCFFGFDIIYSDDNMEQVMAPEFIQTAINLGNFFGAYIARNDTSSACRDRVYSFICKMRGGNGQPIITMDWYNDIHTISEKILSDTEHRTINLAGRVYDEYAKAKNVLTNSLLETLKSIALVSAPNP